MSVVDDGQISMKSTDGAVATAARTEIKHVESEETITIRRPTNHNEISLMENDWLRIKDKINSISLRKRFDVSAIIVGAIIPYTIDIVADYCNQKTPNYFPLVICVVLFIVTRALAKYIPWIGDDNTTENKVHLEDLKKTVIQAEAVSQTKDNSK